MKIAIIGFGFVGKALSNGIKETVDVLKIDPILGTDLNDLNSFRSRFQIIMKSFDSISKYRSVKVIVDVDPN